VAQRDDVQKQRDALEARAKREREILAKFEQSALARWTGNTDSKSPRKEGKDEKKEKKKKQGKHKSSV